MADTQLRSEIQVRVNRPDAGGDRIPVYEEIAHLRNRIASLEEQRIEAEIRFEKHLASTDQLISDLQQQCADLRRVIGL